MNFWILGGAALALGGLSAVNYRRFVPKPKAMGDRQHQVTVRPLPIQTQQGVLYGELLRPADLTNALPTVICCHGFGSSYKLCKNTVGMCLAMSGYQVYCFDFRGGSTRSKSDGSMLEMSIFTQKEDLKAVIDAMLQSPEVDKKHLYLLGESQGGCVAAITAPEYAQSIRALILYYPALCIPDDARKKFSDAEEIPEVYKIMGRKVGKIYAENLLHYDIYREISDFGNPVLILHGDADKIVDVSYARRAAQKYAKAKLKCYPGETHGFTGKGKLEAAKDSYEFLEENR